VKLHAPLALAQSALDMYTLGLLDQASSDLSQVGAADKHTIIRANDFVLPVVVSTGELPVNLISDEHQ
jgi:hypothetical protein